MDPKVTGVLPIAINRACKLSHYFMKKDKKNLNEKINLILIKKIGQTTQPNGFAVNSGEIKKFLSEQYI